MQFEGAEKKAELYIDKTSGCLLNDVTPCYWETLVAKAGAHILSRIANENCHAYILSESSLFIWQDHFIILTCGETNLAKSIEFFITSQPRFTVRTVLFQRKNEYFSKSQPSNFDQDVSRLNRHVSGSSQMLGSLEQHYVQIFQANRFNINPLTTRSSFELLAYHICKEASELFMSQYISANDVVGFLGLSELLVEFSIDGHQFSPYGYSLNAIRGHDYLTLHITPQPNNSYVSVVSNIDIVGFTDTLLAQLKPKAFDRLIISSTPAISSNKVIADCYQTINQQTQTLNNRQKIEYLNLAQQHLPSDEPNS